MINSESKIIFKFPTRGRKDKFFDTLDKYYNFIENQKDYLFLITMDNDDLSMNNQEVKNKLDKYKNLIYFYGDSKTKIEACNNDLDKVNLEEYDILVLLSDDMIPQVKGFDNIIRNLYRDNYPDFDGVLFFNDGFRGAGINTLSILGVKYYKRFNYIYHPSYRSFFCDNEFTIVANNLGKQIYINFVIIKHEHPDNIGEEYDTLYLKNNNDGDIDRINFENRIKNNFK